MDHCKLFSTKVASSTCRLFRDGKEFTVEIQYPETPPTHAEEELLTSSGVNAKKIFCPGCSDQDVCLGRCHGSLLSSHISDKFPHRCGPQPCGMLGIFKPDEMIALVDSPNNVFIGRRPPRGVATKSIGVKKTIKRSKFANPFVVSAKGFKLGESLKLYERWLQLHYTQLTEEEVNSIVKEAPELPNSIEDMLKAGAFDT